MSDTVKLIHGDGGKYTSLLIKNVFYKHFNNELLEEGLDSAVFSVSQGKMAFTTDSFVVKPIFFSGGDVGKLSACGTINDLCVSGAKPLYISAGFIIEEGFLMRELENIVQSMAEVCAENGVKVITGDTKVVEKGSVDGVFINTSGIGIIENNYEIKPVEAGDKIIVTGCIGEHGTAIALERYGIKAKGNFKSDCASLYEIVNALKDLYPFIKVMKDPTRGGLATALNEISAFNKGMGMHLYEQNIPVREETRAINELLGLDHLYMACEGRLILVVGQKAAYDVLQRIHAIRDCKEARIIGSVVRDAYNTVYMETPFGGKRIIGMQDGEMLPRIC